MSGPERDDLMDFFDLSKPFKRVNLSQHTGEWQLAQRARQGQRAVREGLLAPAPDQSQEKEAETAEGEWELYQKEVISRLHEQAAASSHANNVVEQSVHPSCMSGAEADTFVDSLSVVPTPAAAPQGREVGRKGIAEAFNMKKHCEETWRLPIHDSKQDILDKVAANQVVVMSGPTGCGKSTQVPQYILDQHAEQRKTVNIVVTQPRKLAASSMARRVCKERGWHLGGLVGYQVGLDKANKSPDTRLLYVTTGVLKRMLIAKKELNEWTHVILDEVHEREEDMDLVMLICKKLLLTNSRGTKLVLMSATMDHNIFTKYFSVSHHELRIFEKPPFLSVGNKQDHEKKVSEHYWDKCKMFLRERYPNTPNPDFQLDNPALSIAAVRMCKVLLEQLDRLETNLVKGAKDKKMRPGAVLVFLPGIHEIKQVRDFLLDKEDEVGRKGPEWKCIPLHSSIPWEECNEVFDPLPPNQRKVILSTNIAESSLTIPDIGYVIDFCLTKNMTSDPETNYPRLMLDWASQAQLKQRRGRAGRIGNGRVYRLVPEGFSRKLVEYHSPEIQRVPLTGVVLDVKLLEMGSPKELLALALSPPDLVSLRRTIVALKEMGALLTTVEGKQSKEDGDLTVLGEIIAKLPLDVRLGKLTVLGHIFGVLEETVKIAAGLSGKSIFATPFDKRVEAYKGKLYWADGSFSDCVAILRAFQTWERKKRRGDFSCRDGVKNRESAWAKQYFLNKNQLEEMGLLVEEIKKCLWRQGIEPLQIQNPIEWSHDWKFTVLRLVMFGAFYPNYFRKVTNPDVLKLADRTLDTKDPRNTVYFQGFDHQQAVHGELYVDQLKNLLDTTSNKVADDVKLSFVGGNIFAEFYQRPQQGPLGRDLISTGEISSQVYVAVKLRQQNGRDRPSVMVYEEEEATRKYLAWQEAVNKEVPIRVLEEVEPPDMNVKEFPLHVVPGVGNPSLFWIHYGQRSAEMLDTMQRVLNSCLSDLQRVKSIAELVVGNLIIAPFQGEYYRGRVESINQGGYAVVFFLDYGNLEEVKARDLFLVPASVLETHPDLTQCPGLALQCRLAKVQPSSLRSSSGFWDVEAVARFHQLLEEGRIQGRIVGKVFSVVESASGLGKFEVALDEVVLQSLDKEKKVREVLLAEHLGEVATESYRSQKNHEERREFQFFNEHMQKHLNTFGGGRARFGTNVKPQNDTGKQQLKVTLNGPFSPLEHKVTCLHRHGISKGASIDQNSVNAVLLDVDGSSFDQLLVAAQVNVNASGDRLSLQSTSWLPRRPGIGALATLIFSPRAEIRTNKGRSRLTGALTGLGPARSRNELHGKLSLAEKTEAFFPEHDLETRFDVEINNEDLDLVNKTRYWMNVCLSKTHPDQIMRLTQPISLDKAQKGIKAAMEALLLEDRKVVEKEGLSSVREYRWNLKDEEYNMPNEISGDDGFIFKMIDGVRLAGTQDDVLSRVLASTKLEVRKDINSNHLDDLYKQEEDKDLVEFKIKTLTDMWSSVEQGNPTKLKNLVVCPICPYEEVLSTHHALHQHLQTALHKKLEDEIMALCLASSDE